MTRFAWLQTRTQALAVAGLLAALAGLAAVTGVQMSHLFHSSVAHCTTGCGFTVSRFLRHYSVLDNTLNILARAVPALLGMFWGAPLLAREIETGTYRLVWTQGVTRSRWLVSKLAVGAVATAVAAGVLTLTVTWWSTSRDQVGGSAPFELFDRRDVAPIAYALFAFAVGALLGAVVRRTVPAMAATLAVFVAVRVAVAVWLRPHLIAPVRSILSLRRGSPDSTWHLGIGSFNGGPVELLADGGAPPRSWTLSTDLLTNTGTRPTHGQMVAFLQQHCPHLPTAPIGPPPGVGGGTRKVVGPNMAQSCIHAAERTFHLAVTYQPAGRYWAFQWIESGIFVALALAAVVACYWWVTRRA